MAETPEKSRTPSTRSVLAQFKRLPSIDEQRACLAALTMHLDVVAKEEERRAKEQADRQRRLEAVIANAEANGFSRDDLRELLGGNPEKPRRQYRKKPKSEGAPPEAAATSSAEDALPHTDEQ